MSSYKVPVILFIF